VITVLVGLAAAGGAMLRYVVDQLVESTHDMVFPFGTFSINVTGSFVLGLLTGLGLHHGLDPTVITVSGAGLLGGYTTFSTWGWESAILVGDRAVLEASANVLASLGVGAAAAAAGLGLALL
jgi:fluoride exporter